MSNRVEFSRNIDPVYSVKNQEGRLQGRWDRPDVDQFTVANSLSVVRLASVVAGGSGVVPEAEIPESLLEFTKSKRSYGSALKALKRVKGLAENPLVIKIYKNCDFLSGLFEKTDEYSTLDELRDAIWDRRKEILATLPFQDEVKLWALAISFFGETPYLKALTRYYAQITGTSQPDASMQFTAYFTYPQKLRPETQRRLDAFIKKLEAAALREG